MQKIIIMEHIKQKQNENIFKTPQSIYFYNSSNFIHNPSIFKIMKKNIRNAGRKRLFKPDVLTAEIRMIVPSATKIEIIEFINDKKKPYLWKIEL